MKRQLAITFAVLLLFLCAASAQTSPTHGREVIRDAASKAAADLSAAAVTQNLTIALLPLANDGDNALAGALKGELAKKGLACVEAKEDPFFNEIMSQVEWDMRKIDMLDPKTVAGFGKLQAGQLLLYGGIRQNDVSSRSAYAEIELHLSSVITNRHLWGGTFASRVYLEENVKGLIELDEYTREIIRTIFADAAKSLAASTKTGAVSTIAVVPLAGDIDRYATGLAEGMFSGHSKLSPVNLAVNTLAEAVGLLRTTPGRADAILYGAVRDLSVALVKDDYLKGKTYRYHAEIQLRIQTAKGEILWSDTLAAGSDVFVPKDMVNEAITAAANRPRVVLLILGGLLGLIVILAISRMFLRAVSRPR